MISTPFNGIFQIGIVVEDLDATVKVYSDKYGIGPWDYYTMDEKTMSETISDGEERTYSCIMAAARIGNAELELIQPTDDHSRHARFLREKGEGVEHVALAFDGSTYEDTRDHLVGLGLEVTTAGTWNDSRFEFFNTQDDLKFDLEIQSWPADKPYPPAERTYPEAAAASPSGA
jgi:methylmalonyl-CoA/ethylmalonyl-CoA epimerase